MKARAIARIAAMFTLMTATAHVHAEDTQKETQKACQDVKTLNSAIRNLENLNKDSTVSEAQMAEERVDKAICQSPPSWSQVPRGSPPSWSQLIARVMEPPRRAGRGVSAAPWR